MALYLGAAPVVAVYLGAVPAARVHLGGDEVGSWFSPNQLTGLLTWYDASDNATLTVVAGKIAQINDKSGNAFHLAQVTGSSQPPLGGSLSPPNGRQYMGLNATFVINEAVSFPASDSTSFCSCVQRTGGSAPRLMTWSKAGVADNFGANGTIPHYRTSTSQVATTFGGGAASATIVYDQWYVHAGTRSSTEVRSAVDGGADVVVTASVVAPVGPFVRICLGSGLAITSGTSGQVWNGGFGEQFCYNRLLNAAEKAMCEGYLAWKWGTQARLPGGHPWIAGPPPRGN